MNKLMTPTYTHDCNNCRFITATFGAYGLVDWYICGTCNPTIIGRHSSEGADYWSTDVDTLGRTVSIASDVSRVCGADRAFSEEKIVAWWVFNLWRESPEAV
jgi:hypothetical protein